MSDARPRWPATASPPRRVVDAHVHYWQVGAEGLDWPMLAPDAPYPLHRFDDHGAYGPAQHRAESTAVPVTKVVHVQAAQADDPVAETAWLQQMAEADPQGWPNAIVGAVTLAAADAEAVLERQVAHRNFRGVRDVTLSERLGDPALDSGLRCMGRLGVVCDLMVRLPRFDDLAAVADRHPEVVFVLGHGGTPTERTAAFLRSWSDGLRMLGRRPNLVCKISGFGIGDPDWNLTSLRPMVEACLEAFGPGRCIVNGNWPVDKLYSSYDELLGAYDVLTADYSDDERDALFAANAERVYRI